MQFIQPSQSYNSGPVLASRYNNKLKKYASRRPDPNGIFDAFSLTWNNDYYLIFSPFSLLPRILQKIEAEDKTSAVLIAPLWPTQRRWPSLLHLVVGQCYQLPKPVEILHLPHKR